MGGFSLIFSCGVIFRFIVIFIGVETVTTGILYSIKNRKIELFSSKKMLIIFAAAFFVSEICWINSIQLGKELIFFKALQIVMFIMFILFLIIYRYEQKHNTDYSKIFSKRTKQ